MSHQFEVSRHDEGRRVDRVIRALYPDLPLGALMRAFRKGLVRVDGKKVRCSDRLDGGQTVDVPFETPPTKERTLSLTGREEPLPLLYGDDNILVVDKPWGLLTQPARRGEESVVSRLLAFSLAGGSFRPTPVHRLDRNTSGTLLVALNGSALRELHQAWRERAVLKVYLAVVVGEIPLHGEIELPLLKKTDNVVVVSEEGQEAFTRFRRLGGDRELSLVEVELVTGRPHQARAHLAAWGFPLLGDVKYGSEEINRSWRRQGVERPLLHARSLTFREMEDPLTYLTGRTFRAPLPEDMAELVRLRGWKNYLEGV